MDLDGLKIERDRTPPTPAGRGSGGPAGGRRGLPWVRLVLLGLVAAALWWFRAPLLRTLRDARLPTVETAIAYRPDPRAAAAASGTAANGYVIARKRAALSADTPGRIVELLVEEGSVVKKEDLVAQLFSEELRADVAASTAALVAAERAAEASQAQVTASRAAIPNLAAQVDAAKASVEEARAAIETAAAALTLAENERARALELLSAGFESQQRLDRANSDLDSARAGSSSAAAALSRTQAQVAVAQAALERQDALIAAAEATQKQTAAQIPVAQANLERSRATLSKTEVRAPFDGVIVLKDAEVGEVVSPNSQGASSRGSVATMVDFTSLEVQVELPETSIDSVRRGGSAQVFLDAYSDVALPGRVDRIWPTANRQKGTIEVRVVLNEMDERLRPEMGARVVFGAEEADPSVATEEPAAPFEGVLIPADALIDPSGAPEAYVVERDALRRARLTLGERRGTLLEVLAGLADGDRVVRAPAAELADGQRVKFTP